MIEYELFSCKKSKKIDRIISVDMNREAFYPLQKFLDSQIEAVWVEEMKTELIRDRIAAFLDKYPHIYGDYNVIVGQDLSFYLQTAKNTVLIFKIGELSVFIYQAKPFDIPKVKAIENFLDEDLRMGGQDFVDRIVEVVKVGVETEQHHSELRELKNWVGCYFNKHQDVTAKRYETNFLQRLKMFIVSNSREMHWHILFGRRIAHSLAKPKFEEKREILLELDFPQYKDLKYKPRLLIFQRKIKPTFFFGSFRSRWREIGVFFAMLLAFVVFTACPKDPSQIDEMQKGFMVNVCRNKSEILMFLGGTIICLIFYKLITSKNSRKAMMAKFKQE